MKRLILIFLLFCICVFANVLHTDSVTIAKFANDTISVSEENGIRNTVIQVNDTVLEIHQQSDFFSNGRIYRKVFEYNDNQPSTTGVTWFLNDTVEVLRYDKTAIFECDSIYDINGDGIHDLVLFYSGSPACRDIYLFGPDGMVTEEKRIFL